ncbi:fumarate hydratase [Pedobacter alpinus]|uniref:Fumarate hydratase n=1 Tax=Pedobacter alpinus TaxID=1590643 RepID=A0ABW5TS13_9SPHI
MKFNINFLLVLLMMLYLSSCTFNKQVKSSGEDFIQGIWTEDSLPNQDQLASYQQFDFKFNCDSFYVKIKNFSKVNLQGGSCYDSNTWYEYAKGYYVVNNDSLKFEGNFVDSEYKYKTQGSCYRSGKFIEVFFIEQKADNLLKVKSLQSGMLHQFWLKEKLSCKQ